MNVDEIGKTEYQQVHFDKFSFHQKVKINIFLVNTIQTVSGSVLDLGRVSIFQKHLENVTDIFQAEWIYLNMINKKKRIDTDTQVHAPRGFVSMKFYTDH